MESELCVTWAKGGLCREEGEGWRVMEKGPSLSTCVCMAAGTCTIVCMHHTYSTFRHVHTHTPTHTHTHTHREAGGGGEEV